MNAPLPTRVYRADSWIARANSERHREDPDGQFIALWIAFNALYAQPKYGDDDTSDRTDQHAFLSKISRLDTSSKPVRVALGEVAEATNTLLESEFLYLEYWREGYTDELAASLATKRSKIDPWDSMGLGPYLRRLFDRLYVLRNQVFHGCSKDGSGANRASVEPAIAVLRKLVPLFRDFVHASPIGRDQDDLWGPLSYPPKGHPEHRRASELND